jgi:hypothetical protein
LRPGRKPDPGPPGVSSRCTDVHANTAGLHASAAVGILRTTQGRGDIKDHPKGAQLGAQQAGTNSVAISIQGMPFGHHTMLLPKFLFPWSVRWCV